MACWCEPKIKKYVKKKIIRHIQIFAHYALFNGKAQKNRNCIMKRLLIVDDSAALLESMKHILERVGYTVKTLLGPGDIHREIHAFHPDLLILDIALDGEDGREVCRKIKKNAQTENLWVLVFSASLKYLEDYRNYKADDFMEKPFDLRVLVGKIKSGLALKASASD